MTNRYNLDVELTQAQEDEYWDRTSEHPRFGARRVREYYNVLDRNLGIVKAAEILSRVHNMDKMAMDFIDEEDWAFVTDDVELASELIRVLGLDFVHDFKSGLFLFDVWAWHEILMSYIYEGIQGPKYFYGGESNADRAELYVTKGYGCYKSSQSPRIYIGEDVAIPSYLTQFKNKIERL